MEYLKAFILGGLLCVLVQFFYRKTRLSIPLTLTIGFCLGGLLTATGLMDPILALGHGGMIVMIIDSGEAVFRWMTAALAGDLSAMFRYVALILFCWALGVWGGVLYHRRLKSAVEKRSN